MVADQGEIMIGEIKTALRTEIREANNIIRKMI
jgi:hypothetical protein